MKLIILKLILISHPVKNTVTMTTEVDGTAVTATGAITWDEPDGGNDGDGGLG